PSPGTQPGALGRKGREGWRQSKKLMQESGVAVQRFYVADTASEALEAAKRL
ncbi:succinyl-CoA ligase [GDP-forming], partial [Lates japonicus]